MTAEFTMTIPERFAQALAPLHPDGPEHAAAAALRLYLELGKLGVDALQARAKHEGMSEARLIEHLLVQPVVNPGTTITAPKAPRAAKANNVERDREIVDEYLAGGTTHYKLAAKYGLSVVRITQIVAAGRAMRAI